MKVRRFVVFAVLFVGIYASCQEIGSKVATPAASTSSSVPHLVQFSGIATDVNGKPLSGTVGITFLLYREEQGGAPLWIENQNVAGGCEGPLHSSIGRDQTGWLADRRVRLRRSALARPSGFRASRTTTRVVDGRTIRTKGG